jgi:hypothetical protein
MKINEINNACYIQCVFAFRFSCLYKNMPFMHDFAGFVGLTVVGYLNLTNAFKLHGTRSGKWFQYVLVQPQTLLYFLH